MILGDIIFQVMMALIPILFITSVLILLRYTMKRAKQLSRMEEKLNRVLDKYDSN